LQFRIQHTDKESSARTGILETGHGQIQTPIFMPVGTAGTVKSVHQRELADDIKAPIILGNTYHLYLRPGMETLSLAGGLHRFMNWNKAILTDSGGYQVYSLAANRKLSEEGVIFRSHIDGSKHVFTPEGIVDIQRIIGADIIMALDECTSFPCSQREARKSMELTHRWLDRGLQRFTETESKYGKEQLFFPIVQGSVDAELRKISASKIASANCPGNAIGGLSVGEPEEQMYEMISVINQFLPPDKPRYLMGVGTPANILESISLGIDMFDCVMPTRNARNGMLFTGSGIINIRNLKWKNDFSPIDDDGNTFVDQQYSKAYLRHLIISGEILGAQIATIHNLGFYLWLVREAADKISDDSFGRWKNRMIKKLKTRL
jgi:queuine tRNA-ribosyltransferase